MKNVNYIGQTIRNIRLNKKISSTQLCSGLCSPSMLTRIESGERYPDKLLFDALMERMGESGNSYTFIGVQKDIEIYHLIQRSIDENYHQNRPILKELQEQYKKILNPKSNLQMQYMYLFECSLCLKDFDLMYENIMNGINLTMKDFDITKIPTYLLSYAETSLINALGVYYLLTKQPDLAEKTCRNLLFFLDQIQTEDYRMTRIKNVIRLNLILIYIQQNDMQEAAYQCQKVLKGNLNDSCDIYHGKLLYYYSYITLGLDQNLISDDIVKAFSIFMDSNDIEYAKEVKNDIFDTYHLDFDILFGI